ncbi:MAG: hypothetical protein LBV63_02930 [Candidatus Methanoplasma sp.]|jgi:hypothetical protein|nr:hypothetical protein [Candidatus Methanoplasma sp.]
MSEREELKSLKEEVRALRSEVDTLKDFVRAMYSMIGDDEEYDSTDEFVNGLNSGRFNT